MSIIGRIVTAVRLAKGDEKEILDYLRDLYEPALHAAFKECAKTARVSPELKCWQNHVRHIIRMRYHELPNVRERLHLIHLNKDRQFRQIVEIWIDWRGKSEAMLYRRFWKATMYDANGQVVHTVGTNNIDYGKGPVEHYGRFFQEHSDAVSLVLVAPDGTPDPPIERRAIFPEAE